MFSNCWESPCPCALCHPENARVRTGLSLRDYSRERARVRLIHWLISRRLEKSFPPLSNQSEFCHEFRHSSRILPSIVARHVMNRGDESYCSFGFNNDLIIYSGILQERSRACRAILLLLGFARYVRVAPMGILSRQLWVWRRRPRRAMGPDISKMNNVFGIRPVGYYDCF